MSMTGGLKNTKNLFDYLPEDNIVNGNIIRRFGLPYFNEFKTLIDGVVCGAEHQTTYNINL